jgi:hypothetical protein
VYTRYLMTLPILFALAACDGKIYLREGVTDGDTFYLAQRAITDDDPVLQSWVTYSLAVSACQLQNGGDNPARATSFNCELKSRRLLLDSWREKQALDAQSNDAYLDDLDIVDNAGFLPEYVARHFGKRHWSIPDDLEIDAYRKWARDVIPGHKPETRIIGSWNYARNVSSW